MQARNSKSKLRPTFTEQARRAQIVSAAITTIAEVGYRNAAFAQIAKRAGLSSTGLISYHFASKDDLIGEVVATVLADLGAFMTDRMQAAVGARAALRTYIEGNIDFIGTHREPMRALTEIFISGAFGYHPASEKSAVSSLEDILRSGQATGEFRSFDPTVMATLVQRAVDGLPFLIEMRPGLDVAMYRHEVVTAFDLATRA